MKILLNSSPRTGMARLLQYLRIVYKRTDLVNNGEYGEYSNRKDFILWAHSPITILAIFKDVLQITIIRNPDEVIPSICDKIYSGVGLDVYDNTQSKSKINFDLYEDITEYMNQSVYSTSLEYMSYLDNTINNFENLLVFSFYDIVNNVDFIIDTICSKIDEKYLPINKNIIEEIDKVTHERWQLEEKDGYERANRGPVKTKSEEYYKFKDIFLNNDLRPQLLEKYNFLINKINEKNI